ncbi:unnamed protein product [Ostreobium quekettii]|uniref:Uncharacterized protein n=1 Tax=Ostreobium quekettii TaxID=121088 RepID=A0A8S1J342_9CHLO|nr:unnamed protein product [Ostreobium quekettii]
MLGVRIPVHFLLEGCPQTSENRFLAGMGLESRRSCGRGRSCPVPLFAVDGEGRGRDAEVVPLVWQRPEGSSRGWRIFVSRVEQPQSGCWRDGRGCVFQMFMT